MYNNFYFRAYSCLPGPISFKTNRTRVYNTRTNNKKSASRYLSLPEKVQNFTGNFKNKNSIK